MDNNLSSSKPLLENKKMVLIEVVGGIAGVVDQPKDTDVVILDWDIIKDGIYGVSAIAVMFERQGMSSDKALYYAQQIYNEEFDFEDEYEQIMEEFLSGTFDQPFETDLESGE
jgi:hypothetical protein